MLDVRIAALADAAEDDLALVGHAVVVRVGPLHQIVGVGFTRQDDTVLKRQDHARGHELVDEYGVLIVVAVALRALPTADAADRIVFATRASIHHVADHLADIHPAVAVKLDQRRTDDLGVRDHQLHAIAGWKHEAFGFFCRGLRGVGGLGREVGRFARHPTSAATTAEASGAHRRARRLFGRRSGHLVLAIHQRHVRLHRRAIRRQGDSRREWRPLHVGDVLQHQALARH